MASKNDITGDTIQTKVSEKNMYADGWERIFGNKTQKTENESDGRLPESKETTEQSS